MLVRGDPSERQKSEGLLPHAALNYRVVALDI